MSHQVTGGELAHLSGADDKNVLAVQRSKNLLGQFYRDRGDRNRRRSYGSLATNPLCHGKSTGEELIQLAANRTHGAGGGVCLFHLTENLGFANHHRIETRSHAEDMAHGVFLAELVEVWIEILRLKVKMFMQKTAQISRAVGCVSHNFHPVAGGNNHALFNSRVGGEVAASISQARFRDREPLPDLERRTAVIHADELVSHDAANLWMVEK